MQANPTRARVIATSAGVVESASRAFKPFNFVATKAGQFHARQECRSQESVAGISSPALEPPLALPDAALAREPHGSLLLSDTQLPDPPMMIR